MWDEEVIFLLISVLGDRRFETYRGRSQCNLILEMLGTLKGRSPEMFVEKTLSAGVQGLIEQACRIDTILGEVGLSSSNYLRTVMPFPE
jgi:hypothetical protein